MSKQSSDYFDDNELNELEHTYESAMEMLRTHLEVLISNFEMQNGGTKSVEHYGSRLKKISSAVNKLRKKKCEISTVEIEKNLSDMVGIRLVCPFIYDVYDMVKLIKSSDLIIVDQVKDYIRSPKRSGYRSCHLLVRVPVPVGNKIKMVKAEIQIRTLAMDAWAAMEHRIKYKPIDSKTLTDRQKRMLRTCARSFELIEEYMTNLLPDTELTLKNKRDAVKKYIPDFDDDELRQFEFEYKSALKILTSHLKVTINNHNFTNSTKLVEHTNSRFKDMSSIYRKLFQKGIWLTLDNVRNNINDVAAVRLVCPFIDDVYDLVKLVRESDLIEIYEERDYISKPKDSGYRGYHLLVKVPVPVGNEIKMVKAEIQVRTLAMDAWAAMEERLKYNQDYYFTDEQKSMLKICADTFQDVEVYMNTLLNPSEDETSKFDEYFASEQYPKKYVRKKS